MKKLLVFTTVLTLGILFVLPVSGCGTALSTTATTTQPQPTTTLPPGEEPVEIVSVTGPLQPINPGGPIVEITLKNSGAEPIISLSADLFIRRAGPPDMPVFVFTFKVASGNPLLPGNSTSVMQTLIGGGLSDNVSYPLTINGTLQNGTLFSYTKQVLIVRPAK